MREPSKYSKLGTDEIEELLSNFLVQSWSPSKLKCFSQNEKNFERKYIYLEQDKRSYGSISGSAYHEALRLFFEKLKDGEQLSQIQLQNIAYNYIDDVPANEWKMTSTCKTIAEGVQKSTKEVNILLTNFFAEIGVYLDEISEVLEVEIKFREWVTVNGQDIPLPCSCIADLIVKTKSEKIVVIDHKSVSRFSAEKEVAFLHSKQGVTYAICYENKTGKKVDEIWIVENKKSINKDKSPQMILSKIELDSDSQRLYEALLYESLKRMCEAVSNPEYVYLINDTDFTDNCELYDFWVRTQLSEIEDFEFLNEEQKEQVAKRQKKIRDSSLVNVSPKTIKQFRKYARSFIAFDYKSENMTKSEIIEDKLRQFALQVKVRHHITDSYSCEVFMLECGHNVKVDSIARYRLDLAAALNVPNLRISNKSLVMYKEESFIAIEINKKRESVLKWSAEELKDKYKIPIGLDNFGETLYWDISNHSTPHMLVCGATGSGKSVFLRSTIEYAIKTQEFDEIIIMDPKYEFTSYAKKNIEVVNDISDIETLAYLLVDEMQQSAARGIVTKRLIVIDEYADAIDQSVKGKALGGLRSLETNIKMLAQKGRSLGYRIIVATQRASTKIISGDVKVNFPVQVCFRVPKSIDSVVVIDEEGAETLGGGGDGLIKSPEYLDSVKRFQGYYI